MSQKIKKNVVLSIVLMISIVFTRCQNDDDNLSNSEISNVSLAKKWFKEYESGSDNYALFQNLDYEWENAEVKETKNGVQLVIIPVTEAKKDESETWEQKLYIYKLSESNYKALLYEFYPEDTVSIDSKSFNGYISAWDLKSGFVKSAKFENDKIVENGIVAVLANDQLKFKGLTNKQDKKHLDDEDGIGEGSGTPSPIVLKEVVIENNYKDPYTYLYFPRGVDTSGYTSVDYTSSYTGGGGGGAGSTNTSPTITVIAIQKQIYTDKLPPCLKKILDDLIKIDAGPGNMIVKFVGNDPSFDYNWNMETGINNYGVSGRTLPETYGATKGIKTIYDINQFPNATELSWAKTILHESIHAYLITYFYRDEPSFETDYPVLFQKYMDRKEWNGNHHEEIATNLVKSIGDALESYGISKGYKLNKQFYQDMAWGGLEQTDVFAKLSLADRRRISDTLSIELRGEDDYGNKKTQKGKKAGC